MGLGLAVTRALGDRFAKEATEYGIIAVPYVSEVIELTPSDKYLIVATDGVRPLLFSLRSWAARRRSSHEQLWDIVSGQKAFEICQNETTAEAMAQQLVATAVQSTKCQDNVTVIVVVL
jgi:serine/threonine protein phosphatase PrpC